MKKLTKLYHSHDAKLSNYQLGNYGSFNNILEKIVCGDGFNDVVINRIEKIGDKKVRFHFKTSGSYNHQLEEVVNIKTKQHEEFVITLVHNDYLECEYYDDYDIQEVYEEMILVNSSLGFTSLGVTNDKGRYTIQTEDGNVKYHYYDVESTNFTNTTTNDTRVRIVGIYMENEALGLKVPLEKSTEVTNDTLQWNFANSSSLFRRCLHVLGYLHNSKYTIIGNGNFFYFITNTPESIYRQYMIYAFGKYKSYIENNNINYLMVSMDSYPQTSSSINGYTNNYNYSNIKYRFGATYKSFMLNLSTLSSYFNVAATTTTGYNNTYTDHLYNCVLLSGINSPSHFTVAPSAYYGTTSSGVGSIPYPNANNKMYLSSVNIYSGSFSNTTSYNLIGEMPFMKFYAHDKSTLPITPLVNKMKVNINGNISSLIQVDAYESTPLFDVTPKNYNNY